MPGTIKDQTNLPSYRIPFVNSRGERFDSDVLFYYNPTTDTLYMPSVNISGNVTLGDSTSDTVTITGKLQTVLYWNLTGYTDKTIKAHNHLSTSTINIEGKYEYIGTSGTAYGFNNEAHIAATGTASVYANFGVAVVDATFTVSNGTIIGSYGQARVDGSLDGTSFVAGGYFLVEASSAMTASHVCSAWLDSHQANAVTGSHELLYMTNNGAATMDQAFYIYGGNKISNLFELNTVTGMTNAANGSGSDVFINFTIDGVAARLTAKYVA